jgi:hypothetical protein
VADEVAAAERLLRISVTELFHAAVITPAPEGGWSLDIGREALMQVQDRLAAITPDSEAGLRLRGAVGAMDAVMRVHDAAQGVHSEPTAVVAPD